MPYERVVHVFPRARDRVVFLPPPALRMPLSGNNVAIRGKSFPDSFSQFFRPPTAPIPSLPANTPLLSPKKVLVGTVPPLIHPDRWVDFQRCLWVEQSAICPSQDYDHPLFFPHRPSLLSRVHAPLRRLQMRIRYSFGS